MLREVLFIITIKLFIPQMDTCVNLVVNTIKNNSTLEERECKSRKIYYEYEEGDTLILECSTDALNSSTYLSFNGTFERYSNSITKNITFSEQQNNTILECALKEESNSSSIPTKHRTSGQIQVLFRMITAITSNSMSTLMTSPRAPFASSISEAPTNFTNPTTFMNSSDPQFINLTTSFKKTNLTKLSDLLLSMPLEEVLSQNATIDDNMHTVLNTLLPTTTNMTIEQEPRQTLPKHSDINGSKTSSTNLLSIPTMALTSTVANEQFPEMTTVLDIVTASSSTTKKPKTILNIPLLTMIPTLSSNSLATSVSTSSAVTEPTSLASLTPSIKSTKESITLLTSTSTPLLTGSNMSSNIITPIVSSKPLTNFVTTASTMMSTSNSSKLLDTSAILATKQSETSDITLVISVTEFSVTAIDEDIISTSKTITSINTTSPLTSVKTVTKPTDLSFLIPPSIKSSNANVTLTTTAATPLLATSNTSSNIITPIVSSKPLTTSLTTPSAIKFASNSSQGLNASIIITKNQDEASNITSDISVTEISPIATDKYFIPAPKTSLNTTIPLATVKTITEPTNLPTLATSIKSWKENVTSTTTATTPLLATTNMPANTMTHIVSSKPLTTSLSTPSTLMSVTTISKWLNVSTILNINPTEVLYVTSSPTSTPIATTPIIISNISHEPTILTSFISSTASNTEFDEKLISTTTYRNPFYGTSILPSTIFPTDLPTASSATSPQNVGQITTAESIVDPLKKIHTKQLPDLVSLLVVCILMLMTLVCSFIAIYRIVKRKTPKINPNNSNSIDPEIPAYSAQWDGNDVLLQNKIPNAANDNIQDELYAIALPKSQRDKNNEESTYENASTANKSGASPEELQMETIYINTVPLNDTKNKRDWIYANQESTNSTPSKDVYAQIKPKRNRKQPTYINTPKHMYDEPSGSDQPTYSDPYNT